MPRTLFTAHSCVLVVFCTGVYTLALGAAALQRVGGAGCGQSAVHLFTTKRTSRPRVSVALLSQLAAFYGPRNVPLTLFLDNARYQRCELVQAHAGLWHRPGVSAHIFAEPQPDRTLLALGEEAMSERKVSSGLRDDEKRHPSDHRLAHHNHAAALASLLTWNFQLFPKTQVIN